MAAAAALEMIALLVCASFVGCSLRIGLDSALASGVVLSPLFSPRQNSRRCHQATDGATATYVPASLLANVLGCAAMGFLAHLSRIPDSKRCVCLSFSSFFLIFFLPSSFAQISSGLCRCDNRALWLVDDVFRAHGSGCVRGVQAAVHRGASCASCRGHNVACCAFCWKPFCCAHFCRSATCKAKHFSVPDGRLCCRGFRDRRCHSRTTRTASNSSSNRKAASDPMHALLEIGCFGRDGSADCGWSCRDGSLMAGGQKGCCRCASFASRNVCPLAAWKEQREVQARAILHNNRKCAWVDHPWGTWGSFYLRALGGMGCRNGLCRVTLHNEHVCA